jgi:hypothetical protein
MLMGFIHSKESIVGMFHEGEIRICALVSGGCRKSRRLVSQAMDALAEANEPLPNPGRQQKKKKKKKKKEQIRARQLIPFTVAALKKHSIRVIRDYDSQAFMQWRETSTINQIIWYLLLLWNYQTPNCGAHFGQSDICGDGKMSSSCGALRQFWARSQ